MGLFSKNDKSNLINTKVLDRCKPLPDKTAEKVAQRIAEVCVERGLEIVRGDSDVEQVVSEVSDEFDYPISLSGDTLETNIMGRAREIGIQKGMRVSKSAIDEFFESF